MARARAREHPAAKKWHICDDCLEPLSAYLFDLSRQWDRSDFHPPAPYRIQWEVERHEWPFALEWLKIAVSVDYAKDLDNAIANPLERYCHLWRRALQVIHGDLDGQCQSITAHHDALTVALGMLLPDGYYADEERSKPLYEELGEESAAVVNGLQDAARRIRHASVILRAKIERTDIEQDDIGEWIELSPQKIVAHFKKAGMMTSWDTLKKRLEDQTYPNKKVHDRLYRFRPGVLPNGANKSE